MDSSQDLPGQDIWSHFIAGLDELLKDCRRRAIDVVVVWKFDRFARSVGEPVRAGIGNARKKMGTILGRAVLRVRGPKDVVELKKLRRHKELPFRELAERFGVSVWTAHRLCQNRPLGSKPGGF